MNSHLLQQNERQAGSRQQAASRRDDGGGGGGVTAKRRKYKCCTDTYTRRAFVWKCIASLNGTIYSNSIGTRHRHVARAAAHITVCILYTPHSGFDTITEKRTKLCCASISILDLSLALPKRAPSHSLVVIPQWPRHRPYALAHKHTHTL